MLKKGTTLRNVTLDKASDKSVAEQLRDTLSAQAVRVIDLFREWDEDQDGTVSKKEFRKAMPMLGLGEVPRSEIDALFDEWDPDGSGSLDLKELNKCLRRGAEVQLDASMQAGAAGEITLKAATKHTIRKGPTRATTIRKIDLDEDSDKSYAQQLRDALTQQAVRVIDLFREWDEDGDGEVSKAEFRRAMPLLGLDVPREEIDKLFDEWDPDGSGTIELRELNTFLRRGMADGVHRPWLPGAEHNKLMRSEAFQARLRAAEDATLATSSYASTVANLQAARPLLQRPPRLARHRYRAVADSEAPNSDGSRRGSPPRRPPSHVEVLQVMSPPPWSLLGGVPSSSRCVPCPLLTVMCPPHCVGAAGRRQGGAPPRPQELRVGLAGRLPLHRPARRAVPRASDNAAGAGDPSTLRCCAPNPHGRDRTVLAPNSNPDVCGPAPFSSPTPSNHPNRAPTQPSPSP